MNIDWLAPEVVATVLVIAVVVVTFVVVLLSKARRVERPQPDLSIALAELDASGPPDTGPRLEFYHVPVRLAAVVVAAAGRGARLPSNDKMPAAIDSIVPGLMDVMAAHRPTFRRWPAQLSSQGFHRLFFANLALRGDGGKGTPWSAVAGPVEHGGRKLLVGLVLGASQPNTFGQHEVAQPHAWLDVLRVKGGEP